MPQCIGTSGQCRRCCCQVTTQPVAWLAGARECARPWAHDLKTHGYARTTEQGNGSRPVHDLSGAGRPHRLAAENRIIGGAGRGNRTPSVTLLGIIDDRQVPIFHPRVCSLFPPGPLGHERPYTFDAHGRLQGNFDPKDRELLRERNTRRYGKTEYGVDHRTGQALNRSTHR